MLNYTFWKKYGKKINFCMDIFAGGIVIFSGIVIYLSKYAENFNVSIDL